MYSKRRKTPESLTGIGEVHWKGRRIARVTYTLRVEQEADIVEGSGRRRELDGLRPIEGQLLVLEGGESLVDKDHLTLHMEDGRQADFFVTRGAISSTITRGTYQIRIPGGLRQIGQ